MKNKIFFLIIFIMCSHGLLAQDFTKRLNFVLLIDNEIPENEVFEGVFIIKDSIGVILKDKIPFKYHVGRIMLSQDGYDRLFSLTYKASLIIKFMTRNLTPQIVDNYYEIEIPVGFMNREFPRGFLNDEYIICRIFNSSLEENRLKYNFRGKKYIFNLTAPALSTILRDKWPGSIKKKQRLNQR